MVERKRLMSLSNGCVCMLVFNLSIHLSMCVCGGEGGTCDGVRQEGVR